MRFTKIPETTFSISIHAPREGSDLHTIRAFSERANFYPRSPRGERPCRWMH